jgi:methanogenic corrinoid protein MtbC1
MQSSISQESYSQFIKSLLAGKRADCLKIINQHWEQNVSLKDLYENLLKRVLYEIGELWEYNKISVATEHLASAIVETILNDLYLRMELRENCNKSILTSCVENEYHQIGIKMISDIFELNGWNTYFLGANTPIDELIDFANTIDPDLFAISISIYSHLPILEEMIQAVRKQFPELPILVGGQAFQHGGSEVILKYYKVLYLSDTEGAENFIKSLN